MLEDRIIEDDCINIIGRNLRRIRKGKHIRQTDMVTRLQAYNVNMTRETLVKIEGGRQHIKLTQLWGIRKLLDVPYEQILEEQEE